MDNFEHFRDELGEVYCIPSSQSAILAMDGSWTLGGTSHTGYAAGTEANLKATIADFAVDANQHTDSRFFLFLSSHGLVYTVGLAPCSILRGYGSFSALGAGAGQDGILHDCELGQALSAFDSDVQQFIAVDCSFCGGFSDSLTAASGTIPDGAVAASSGVPKANRIVVTGCAMTTECFGGGVYGGSNLYDNMRQVLDAGAATCDGWTAPGFPTVQGFDVPVKGTPVKAQDGLCTASEWFFASVWEAYTSPVQPVAIQQQFRIKYGMGSLAADILVA